MTIYRTIYTSTPNLDFSNTGLHWTRNENYQHNGGSAAGITQKQRYQWTLIAEVSAENINAEATAESNKQHPREQEVVLNANQILSCEIWCFDTEEEEDMVEGEDFTINTGTRCDPWVLEYM